MYNSDLVKDYFLRKGNSYQYSIKDLLNKHKIKGLSLDYNSIPHESEMICSVCGQPIFEHLMPRRYYTKGDFYICGDCNELSSEWLKENKNKMINSKFKRKKKINFSELNINIQFQIVKLWLDNKGKAIFKYKPNSSISRYLEIGIFKPYDLKIDLDTNNYMTTGKLSLSKVRFNLDIKVDEIFVEEWIRLNPHIFVKRFIL